MWGAVIGDIAGSRFEGSRGCPKTFELFHRRCTFGFGMEAPMSLPMSKLPPGPRAPSAVQLLKWVFAPLPFMQACADRYGDTFTVRQLGFPPMVFFTDPGAIRQIFTGDPEQFRAGKANAVFEMFFGPNSLLLLDGVRHRRECRLLMPPFHCERMRLYAEMMCEIADRSIDAWPVERSFPVHARLQDITLEVMLRVVFGVADESRLVRLGKAVVEALDLWDVGNPFRPIRAPVALRPCAPRDRRAAARRGSAPSGGGTRGTNRCHEHAAHRARRGWLRHERRGSPRRDVHHAGDRP